MREVLSNEHAELEVLWDILPKELKKEVTQKYPDQAIREIVLDLGRVPEIRSEDRIERCENLSQLSQEDIDQIVKKIGLFNTDNRAGIPRTLHRISAIRNRHGKIIGLTCRIGRAIPGGVELIRDQIESGKNILLLGPPGIGKTTLLREVARVSSCELNKRVIVVDTSNEIAGEGDIPHSAIGFARRMQVPTPEQQHAVMIEAVENHMPQVIIVDEIGTEQEALAARTIAERGIQLVATAHGKTLQNLIKNPTLSDLVGGVQSVILGDEEAKFRGTQKTVLERKNMPTFDVLIEIQEREVFALYKDVARSVDTLLKNEPLKAQVRRRVDSDMPETLEEDRVEEYPPVLNKPVFSPKVGIFPYGINATFLASAIRYMGINAQIARSIDEANIIVTLKSQLKPRSKLQQIIQGQNIPIHVLNTSTDAQIEKFLRTYFHLSSEPEDIKAEAIYEVKTLAKKARSEGVVVDASPRELAMREVQIEALKEWGFNAQSVGVDLNSRVRIYPANKE